MQNRRKPTNYTSNRILVYRIYLGHCYLQKWNTKDNSDNQINKWAIEWISSSQKKKYKRLINVWEKKNKCKTQLTIREMWAAFEFCRTLGRRNIYKKYTLTRLWGMWNPFILLLGMETGEATTRISMESPQKAQNRTTIWSSYTAPGYTTQKYKLHSCIDF